MIKIIIVDDEKLICEGISNMLNLFCDNTEVIASCGDVKTAVRLIKEKKPDLILLDIKIQGGSGFDIIKQLGTYVPHVIFITAYEDYAINAFKHNAIDYLVKPLDPDELEAAINKIEKIKLSSNNTEIMNMLIKTIDNKEKPKKIVLRTKDSIHLIQISDILYCAAEGSYTTVYTHDNKVMVSKLIKEYEEILSEHNFMRIHQSYLINMNKIIRYDKEAYVLLENNIKLPVASRRKELFLKTLSQIFE